MRRRSIPDYHRDTAKGYFHQWTGKAEGRGRLFCPNLILPGQQNLWVSSGSGSLPSVGYNATSSMGKWRKPYERLVTMRALLFRPSTAADENTFFHANEFRISGSWSRRLWATLRMGGS